MSVETRTPSWAPETDLQWGLRHLDSHREKTTGTSGALTLILHQLEQTTGSSGPPTEPCFSQGFFLHSVTDGVLVPCCQTILEIMIWRRCHPLGGQQCRIRKWWLCLLEPLRGSGSRGGLHRVPNPQGWTIGFLGWPVLVLRAPPRCLSSRRCMNVDGTFHCQKLLQQLVLPCHSRWRSGAGVYGGPASGAISCDAIVSKYRFHLRS